VLLACILTFVKKKTRILTVDVKDSIYKKRFIKKN